MGLWASCAMDPEKLVTPQQPSDIAEGVAIVVSFESSEVRATLRGKKRDRPFWGSRRSARVFDDRRSAVLLAEEAFEDGAVGWSGWRRRHWSGRGRREWCGRRLVRARARFLAAALERCQPVLDRGIAAFQQVQLVTNVGLQPLVLNSLASQFGPVLGHAHLHIAHLLHERLFVVAQLLAL